MLADLRYALRQLAKKPGFSAIVLLTLALCIGATTAIFSMVYALLLKPLPYPQPDRIVEIYNSFPKAGLDHFPCNVVQYADFKAHAPSLAAIAMMDRKAMMVGPEGHATRVQGATGSAENFEILGLRPVIGQFFTLKNSLVGEDKVVVITESFWESQYHRDPGIVGQKLQMDGEAYLILGVAPDSIGALDARTRFFVPYAWKPSDVNPQARYACYIAIYARLKPGATIAQAQSETAALEQRFYDAAPPGFKAFLDHSGHHLVVGGFQAEKVGGLRSTLYLLQWGVVFVLAIGCVNIANLLLTRANGRQSELAVRTALGASRWAIARQLLVESLVLSLLGSLLGLGLAWSSLHAINHFAGKLMPEMAAFTLDAGVLAFALGLSLVVALLIGVLPVVHTLRSNLVALIHRSSRSVAGNRGVRALSSILVTGQIAAALVLLTGAGLLIHSFARALAVNPGFDPSDVMTGRVALPRAYDKPGAAPAAQRRVLAGMLEIPGVESAALSNAVPFQGGLGIQALSLKDASLMHDSSQPGAYLVGASIGYFQTLHIQLLEGRLLEEQDIDAKRDIYVVDERFEKRFFGGKSAVGQLFTFGQRYDKDADWPLIVGVVRNVPHNGVEDRSNQPFVYYPMLRHSDTSFIVFVRSTRATGDIATAVRDKLAAIDSGIALLDASTLDRAVSGSFDNRRAVMLLLGAFAALALFLSAIGIYGVLAYDVSQRTREIGVRGAIGASRGEIIGMVMRQGLLKAGIGLAIGLVSAVLLSHLMASLLFDLKPTDPWAYAGVSVLLAAAAALASYLPARSAAAIEPIEALRFE